jgi:hypothetical protein
MDEVRASPFCHRLHGLRCSSKGFPHVSGWVVLAAVEDVLQAGDGLVGEQ